MAPNSLFAILLRSPWWASLALAAALALLARALLPERFAAAGMLGSFPFVIIAAVAAAKQWRAPSATQTAQALQQLNAMSQPRFRRCRRGRLARAGPRRATAEGQRRRPGTEQKRADDAAGLPPLEGGQRRRRAAARTACRAAAAGRRPSIYLASGALSDKAQSFAKQMNIRIVDASEPALLMRSAGVLPKA